MKELLRYGIILSVICAVAAGLLAGAHSLTKNKIEAQAAKEESESLKEVFPQADTFTAIKSGDKIIYYKAADKTQKTIGIVFIAQGKGYCGDISTMAGIMPDGTINAIKILSHAETPGLGARIEEIKDDTTIFQAMAGKKRKEKIKPWFQEQFAHKNVRKLENVQAITGATISSRAVVDSVEKKGREILDLVSNDTQF